MKKRIILFSLMILLFSMIMCLTACEKDSEDCNHSGTWSVTKESTCEKQGIQSRECEKCGYTDTKKIPALGHTEVIDASVPADCDTDGLSQGSHCSVCGKVLIAQEKIEAAGHTEVIDQAVAATCTTSGLTEGKKCSVCKTVISVQETVPALNHSYNETISVAATCSQSGTKKFKCVRCDDSYTESYSLTEYTASEIYELAQKSVGEIITYDKSGNEYALGTGFVYTADGRIITNYHVIEGAYSAKITINGTKYDVVSVLAYDKDVDLAVLKINANNLPVVRICTNTHAVGNTVYALGSSQGLTATFSQGIITYASREIDGVKYVQHDAAISSGNSGGPLINKFGEIIGVNTWTVRDSQNLNFAICVSELPALSYGEELTLAELCEKETSAFDKLKNYIVANGEYEDGQYAYMFGEEVDEYNYSYARIAVYDVEYDVIFLTLMLNENYMVMVGIEEDSDVYEWIYLDDDGYLMSGTLSAKALHHNSILNYDYNNITGTADRADIQEFASDMVIVLCYYIDEDCAPVGVTAEDLGFVNF